MIGSNEAAVETLAAAANRVERSDLNAVQTLLDAIYYLRTGKYPSNRLQPARITKGKSK